MNESDSLKRAAGEFAVTRVEDGMIVGLGTGSTAKFAVEALGKRVAAGLRITGIPTSEQTAEQARRLGIPLATFDEYTEIDLTIDGADEVEKTTLGLIKGGGGALLREKIVASASKRLIIVADESKFVDSLGKFPVPVEVVPFGWQVVAKRLKALRANPVLRRSADDRPFLTDGGHHILDCAFAVIRDPDGLAREMDSIAGVVEHGLFLGMATEVVIGGKQGVTTMTAKR